MKQSRTRIARTIADKTLSKGVSKKLTKEIAAYLLSERRVNDLDSIARDVQSDWAKAGYVQVVAKSAHLLTEAVRRDIIKEAKKIYPQAKQVDVIEVHDPTIIGGVRLQVADKQLDLSIEATLNKFKQLTAVGKDY